MDLGEETPLGEEQEAAQDALEETEEQAYAPKTDERHPRSGLSSTGVPLASLTDPSLFEPTLTLSQESRSEARAAEEILTCRVRTS